MSINISTFSNLRPSKNTQIKILGLKRNHLATLACMCSSISFTRIPEKDADHLNSGHVTPKHFRRLSLHQGCQMISFQTKNTNLGKFQRTLDGKF
jgi:hypothetical protein